MCTASMVRRVAGAFTLLPMLRLLCCLLFYTFTSSFQVCVLLTNTLTRRCVREVQHMSGILI